MGIKKQQVAVLSNLCYHNNILLKNHTHHHEKYYLSIPIVSIKHSIDNFKFKYAIRKRRLSNNTNIRSLLKYWIRFFPMISDDDIDVWNEFYEEEEII